MPAPCASSRSRWNALPDQDVFAGVGNTIKNEVLFRIKVHPLSTVGALPAKQLRHLGAIPLKKAQLGRTSRRSFFCENCQVLYA